MFLATPLSPTELGELEAFLASKDVPETSLDLSGLNGFLTAVALTPAPVLPSQWIPLVWDPQEGKETPEFETVEQAQQVMGLVMRYFNGVVGEIEAGEFAPVFYAVKQDDGNEAWDAESWASAFMVGVTHFSESWDPLLSGHMERIAPMVMVGTERGREAVRNSADPEHARRVARDAIAAAVADLEAHALPLRRQAAGSAVHAHKRAALHEPQRRAEPKVGRNDPCPCGSGKKFKKCCGVVS